MEKPPSADSAAEVHGAQRAGEGADGEQAWAEQGEAVFPLCEVCFGFLLHKDVRFADHAHGHSDRWDLGTIRVRVRG